MFNYIPVNSLLGISNVDKNAEFYEASDCCSGAYNDSFRATNISYLLTDIQIAYTDESWVSPIILPYAVFQD